MKDYSFGNYICALRRGIGLSQFQLGALVGVTDKAVSKWENSSAKPRLSTCFRLADVLGVPIEDLLSCKQHTATAARKENDKMNSELWSKALERLNIYGDDTPALCWSRLMAEKAALYETAAIQSFELISILSEEARKSNCYIFDIGTVSSFTAWLLGATRVNPLPPHYRCAKCRRTEFVSGYADGFDLPEKQCECGARMLRDGHNIPFDGYAKAVQRGTRIDIRMTPSFIPTVADKIKEYYAGKNDILPVRLVDNENKAVSGFEIYVVLDGSREKPPVSEDGIWYVSHEEYWKWLRKETTYTVGGNNNLELVQRLQERTGERLVDPLDHITPEYAKRLFRKRCSTSAGIAEIQKYIEDDTVIDYSLLLKTEGFIHGSNVWMDRWYNDGVDMLRSNGEALVKEGRAKLCDIPAFREDVFNDICRALKQADIRDNGLALQMLDAVKLGTFCRQGLPSNISKMLLEIGLPEWYLEFLGNVWYMFPKGHCISLLLTDIICEWYEENYPAAFAAVKNSKEG